MPATRATEHEWSLLRAACASGDQQAKTEHLASWLQATIRWDVVSDLAESHGVQPLLYHALAIVQQSVPAEHFQALAQKYQTNIHKSLVLSRELIRIVAHLADAGIEAIPYKGLALAEEVYGDIALRQAGDIDLLIHAADLSRVVGAVRDLGYAPHVPFPEAQASAYLKSGYECSFDGAAGPNLLEVQWAIQPRFYAVDLNVDELFTRAQPITVVGHPMKTLAAEDLFIVLSLHAAKHVWGRLIWLCDLAWIISRQNLDWNRIGAQADKLRIVRLLQVTLLLVHRILGIAIPSAAMVHFPDDPVARSLADEIQPHIFSEEAFNVESTMYFRLMLRLRENVTDRIRFVSRLVLTPGPGEWEAVHLPPALSPLYRIVRMSRLAARLVRA